MPRVTVNGAELHYDESGNGPDTVVMAHGLLLDGRMFDGVVARLCDTFRCVTFDFRGQGRSAVTPARYDLDALTDDAAAVLRELGHAPCHFLGFSMGGFVGMRLAVRHPELLRSLVLVGTASSPESRRLKYRLLGWAARCFGVRAVAPLVMPVQFGQPFLRDPARAALRGEWFDRIARVDRTGGLLALDAVIRRADFSLQIHRIHAPTLLVVGADDRATPVAESRKLHAGIRGSELVVVPSVGHAVPIEAPTELATAVTNFLHRRSC